MNFLNVNAVSKKYSLSFMIKSLELGKLAIKELNPKNKDL